MQREGQTTGRIGPFQYAERRTASVINHHMKSISSSSSKADKKDKDRAYVIPTGSLFVSETVVKGVLPQVLDEILATRAMLKRAAKTYKKSAKHVAPSVLRSLEAKQLAVRWLISFIFMLVYFVYYFAAARNSQNSSSFLSSCYRPIAEVCSQCILRLHLGDIFRTLRNAITGRCHR